MATPSPQTTGSSSTVNPVTCVKNVLSAGKIDPKVEKQNKEILTTFLNRILSAMKENDKDFARLYQKLYYTGSYYENLRISDPNEFDINLVLKLPFKPEVREFEYVEDVKSFMKYKLNTNSKNNGVLEENADLLKTLFEGEYLSPDKVRRWIQGVVDRARPTITLPTGVKKIIPSASGPAKTMVLETVYGYNIDIDLVPVIQFSYPEWPQGARKDMLNKSKFDVKNEDQFWFLVPKEFQNSGPKVNLIDAKRLWRIHFPEIEKKIIHNRGQVKPVIKLLKALRNNEGWSILASYYLKTIVLWLVEKNPAPDYWKENNIFTRLIEGSNTTSVMATPSPQATGSSPTVNPVTCVKNVLAAGKIDPEIEKRNTNILTTFLNRMLPEMIKKDKDFARLYQKLYYTGSYYENLRISEPNEFDINLVLKLPFKPEDRELEYVEDVKSFMMYKLKNNLENNGFLEENADLLKKLFEGEYLSPDKVRCWIQSVVDRASPTVILPTGVTKIIPSSSGPAKKMVLETIYGYNIDIDLVPVIQFFYPEWPQGARTDMLNNSKFDLKKETKKITHPSKACQNLPGSTGKPTKKKAVLTGLDDQTSPSRIRAALQDAGALVHKVELLRSGPEFILHMGRQDSSNISKICNISQLFEKKVCIKPYKKPKNKSKKKSSAIDKIQVPAQQSLKFLPHPSSMPGPAHPAAAPRPSLHRPAIRQLGAPPDVVQDQFWFLVPKEFPASGTKVNPTDAKLLWRIHFPEIEKKIIHDRGQVKPIIKLLKALRNNERWEILSSYYLKTVVLWLVEKNPGRGYWKERNIFKRLIEALESLRKSVKKKCIKCYFYPEFNLIQKIGQSQADIICNRLEKILKDIKANPVELETYFKIGKTGTT